ncbi:hypothetical protein MTO96_002168 [Rhipicephalus appendiculatus]
MRGPGSSCAFHSPKISFHVEPLLFWLPVQETLSIASRLYCIPIALAMQVRDISVAAPNHHRRRKKLKLKPSLVDSTSGEGASSSPSSNVRANLPELLALLVTRLQEADQCRAASVRRSWNHDGTTVSYFRRPYSRRKLPTTSRTLPNVT